MTQLGFRGFDDLEIDAGFVARNPGRRVHAAGRCLHCGRRITAYSAAEWSRAVKAACPHCGRRGW